MGLCDPSAFLGKTVQGIERKKTFASKTSMEWTCVIVAKVDKFGQRILKFRYKNRTKRQMDQNDPSRRSSVKQPDLKKSFKFSHHLFPVKDLTTFFWCKISRCAYEYTVKTFTWTRSNIIANMWAKFETLLRMWSVQDIWLLKELYGNVFLCSFYDRMAVEWKNSA